MRFQLSMAAMLALTLSAGCSTHRPTRSATSDHVVDASSGYMRLRGVEPADIRLVVTQLAESKQWTRVSDMETGSYAPATKDDFVRRIDVYRDPRGSDIRIEWVWEKGHDAVVLISADSPNQQLVSTAIGGNILRRQQGMPPLAY